SWKSMGGKSTCAHSGCSMVSHCRYAARRHSSMNSGSFLMDDRNRMVSSFSPFGIVTDSISVSKPAVYSRSRKLSIASSGCPSGRTMGRGDAGLTVGPLTPGPGVTLSVTVFIYVDSMPRLHVCMPDPTVLALLRDL